MSTGADNLDDDPGTRVNWLDRGGILAKAFRMIKDAETETKSPPAPSPTLDLAGHAFYLLVEDAGRELSARLLMAIQLAERGAEVWIGQQLWFAANFPALKPGVALFKGMNMPQVANMRAARLAGHRTAVIDEELFGLTDTSGKRLHDHRAARHCDLFLAEGEHQRRFLERDLGVPSDQITVSGNPRVDLLRPPLDGAMERAAGPPRARMGPFILVNTNFGAINPHDQDAFNYFRRCVAIQAVDPTAPDSMRNFHDLCAFETSNLRAISSFIAETRRLAPDRKIVVRPHPAENPNIWREAHAGDSQVVIIEDNRHLAWIRAADAMVHTSCTTGLEGYLLGARVIGLVPDPDSPWSRRYLSNKVGEIHTDPKTAARALAESHAAQGARTDQIQDHLRVNPNEMASKSVVRALGRLSQNVAPTQQRVHLGAPFRPFRANQRQLDQLSVDEAEVGNRLNALRDGLGIDTPCDIETIDANVFRVFPASRNGRQ